MIQIFVVDLSHNNDSSFAVATFLYGMNDKVTTKLCQVCWHVLPFSTEQEGIYKHNGTYQTKTHLMHHDCNTLDWWTKKWSFRSRWHHSHIAQLLIKYTTLNMLIFVNICLQRPLLIESAWESVKKFDVKAVVGPTTFGFHMRRNPIVLHGQRRTHTLLAAIVLRLLHVAITGNHFTNMQHACLLLCLTCLAGSRVSLLNSIKQLLFLPLAALSWG